MSYRLISTRLQHWPYLHTRARWRSPVALELGNGHVVFAETPGYAYYQLTLLDDGGFLEEAIPLDVCTRRQAKLAAFRYAARLSQEVPCP